MSQPTQLPWPPKFEARFATDPPGSYVLNGYYEQDSSGDVWVGKLPGAQLQGSAGSTPLLGYYATSSFNEYTVTNSGFYQNGVLIGGAPATAHIPFWFDQTNGTPGYVYASNGVAGYYITGGVATQITDVTYTGTIGNTVPGSAYLDGTLYVMNSAAQIFGTKNLNDPTTWDATNMIAAQDTPGAGLAITKHLIYVVAFKSGSTELFYDAGAYSGTTTGSPLLPVPNAKVDFGLAITDSVATVGDEIFWIARGRDNQIFVARLAGGKAQIVSNSFVNRALSSYGLSYLKGFAVQLAGKFFYVLTNYTWHTPTVYPAGPSGNSLAYDIQAKEWCFLKLNGLYFSVYAWDANISRSREINTGSLVYFPQSVSTDFNPFGGAPAMTLDIMTLPFDGGTARRKVLSKLYLKTDAYQAGSLLVRWSDDDYKTWSPWTTVNLQQDRPYLTNLGTFVRRAFHFRHNQPTPFRMKGAEMELLVGN